MKISCIPDHPNFDPLSAHMGVVLDDRMVYGAVTADTDEGWIETAVLNEDGTQAGTFARSRGRVALVVDLANLAKFRPSNFTVTAGWLHACGKERLNEQHLSVQVGCHIEETLEFIEQLQDLTAEELSAVAVLEDLAGKFKRGDKLADFKSRVLTLDALCDAEVTGNGVAFLAGWNKILADSKVLQANNNKMVDGKPVILEGGKIGKPEGWVPADLSDCV